MNTTTKSLTRADWLHKARLELKQAAVDSAELDTLILLEDSTSIDRAHLLANPDVILSNSQLKILNKQIKRRLNHEPLAYIRNLAWFYGRSYYVNKDVLVPRPDSEAFIDILKTINLKSLKSLADLGSGSGCLGISAKLEFPDLNVVLYDKSPTALLVSEANTSKYGLSLTQNLYDLTKSNLPNSDIFVANLPYIPSSMELSKDVGFEPSLALFSGEDGLDLYITFWEKLDPNRVSLVLTECLENQHSSMIKLAKTRGYKLQKTLGLVQLFSK